MSQTAASAEKSLGDGCWEKQNHDCVCRLQQKRPRLQKLFSRSLGLCWRPGNIYKGPGRGGSCTLRPKGTCLAPNVLCTVEQRQENIFLFCVFEREGGKGRECSVSSAMVTLVGGNLRLGTGNLSLLLFSVLFPARRSPKLQLDIYLHYCLCNIRLPGWKRSSMGKKDLAHLILH